MVVLDQPGIEISLQLVDAVVELIQYSAMEALADSIGLRALGLGTAVINVLDREVELVFMALGPAKLGAAIGQHARQPDTVLVIERHHPVVEDLGSRDRGLAVIEFGKGDLGIGIDEGLLICISSDLIRQSYWFSEVGAGGRDAVLTRAGTAARPPARRRPR